MSRMLAGRDDMTVCYHCGGGLQDWLHTDDPCTKHLDGSLTAFMSGTCSIVMLHRPRMGGGHVISYNG